MTQKSLQELFIEKAFSMMGNRRIKLSCHPSGCKDGEIVGLKWYDNAGNGEWYLNVILDNKTQVNILPSGYLEVFRYDLPDDGIKAELSEAARQTVRIPRPHAKTLENFDVVKNDAHFQIASRIAPDYVSWELIKAAEHVMVLNKLMTSTSDDSDLFTIEAKTPRGIYRTTARLDQLTLNAAEAESLPYAPGSAIGIAKDVFQNWFSLKDPNIPNRIFDQLDEEEMDTHYLIGLTYLRDHDHQNLPKSLSFVDDRGNLTKSPHEAIAMPYDGKETADLEKEWQTFFKGHFNFIYQAMIVPANRLADEPASRMR